MKDKEEIRKENKSKVGSNNTTMTKVAVEAVKVAGLAETKSTDIVSRINNVDDLMAFASVLQKSDIFAKYTPAAIATKLLIAREVNVPELIGAHNIHFIDGRPSLGVHLVNALLLRAGVEYKVIKDFAPQRRYVDRMGTFVDEEFVNKYRITDESQSKPSPDKFIREKVFFVTDPEKSGYEAWGATGYTVNGFYDVKPFIDCVTEIYFKRTILIAGKSVTMEHTEKFYWQDAIKAKLSTKDNWQNYPKKMSLGRCFIFGGRVIAPDAIMGMMTIGEGLDIAKANIPTTIDIDYIDEDNTILATGEELSAKETINIIEDDDDKQPIVAETK